MMLSRMAFSSLIIMVTFVSARVLPVPLGSAGAAGFCWYRWVLLGPLGSAGTAGLGWYCWYRWVLPVPLGSAGNRWVLPVPLGSAGTAGFCRCRWVLLVP